MNRVCGVGCDETDNSTGQETDGRSVGWVSGNDVTPVHTRHLEFYFMNKKRAKKYNMRRKFFNSEKPHCKKCGSVFVMVRSLDGVAHGEHCPLC